jgi:hypothetical protein
MITINLVCGVFTLTVQHNSAFYTQARLLARKEKVIVQERLRLKEDQKQS